MALNSTQYRYVVKLLLTTLLLQATLINFFLQDAVLRILLSVDLRVQSKQCLEAVG